MLIVASRELCTFCYRKKEKKQLYDISLFEFGALDCIVEII